MQAKWNPELGLRDIRIILAVIVRLDWAGSRLRSAERSDDLKRNAASAVQSAMYRTAMPEIIGGLAREIESFVHRHRRHACTLYATETRIAIGPAREGIGAPIMMMHHSAAVSESSHIHTEGSSQSGECPFAKLRDRDLSHLFGGRSARPTDQQIRIDGILRPPSRHFLVGRDDESAIDALRPETVLEFESKPLHVPHFQRAKRRLLPPRQRRLKSDHSPFSIGRTEHSQGNSDNDSATSEGALARRRPVER